MISRKLQNSVSATVALGGGGARGLAHLGALQAIQEGGFCVRRIVGTSIGSLVGGIYAAQPNLAASMAQVINYVTSPEFNEKQDSLCGASPRADMAATSGMLAWYDRIKSYLWARSLLSRVFRRRSLLSGKVIEEVIEQLVPDIDIKDTQIPLSVVAVDLKSGHQVVLEQGSLRRAILASTAIPGIFPPVEWDDMLLCDFGVLDSLPTLVASGFGNELVIGVDVGPSIQRVEECESALHILLRMDEIGERLYRRRSQEIADILIQPEVGRFQWFDFSQPEQLIQTGRETGRAEIVAWQNRHLPNAGKAQDRHSIFPINQGHSRLGTASG